MSNGVTHSIYTAAVCGLDIQIGNVGERHGRAEGQQSRICWLDESEDGWMVGWSVGWLVVSTHGNEEALASFYTWPVGRRRFIYTAAIAFKTSPS
jgi:hypothetical protein